MSAHPQTPRDRHRRAGDHLEAPASSALDALPIDEADLDDLTGVPGIDRSLAERIVAYRDDHGGHIDGPDDLHHVPGLTSHLVNRLRERLAF